MNETPLISVLVPVFNGEKYLGESLASVLGQTYANIEVIVLDDASTDGTRGVVAAFDDPRLRYHRNPSNRGQFGNLNVGLTIARGEFIAIQHADDVYLPEILETEWRFLHSHHEVGAVFSLDLFIDADGREFGRVEPPADLVGRTYDHATVLNEVLRHGNVFIRSPTSLVRHEVYERVGGFSSDYAIRGDLDMWLRLAEQAPIAVLDEYLTRYRWGHDNLSRRYGYLRAEPEHYFAVVDVRLAAGGSEVAEADALRAHEGRRAEDFLMVATTQYILDDTLHARATLKRVSAKAILATRRVQRWRLLTLLLALRLLTRLPRSGFVARSFRLRWHGPGSVQATMPAASGIETAV